MTKPTWLDCTVEQWEKKAEISIQNGEMAEMIKFGDYANCREMYDNGMEIEVIQQRFDYDE